MNQATALWSALQAAASLGDAKFDPPRVEALAQALSLERERVPALISQLQKSGNVAIGWGGVIEVLPEQTTGTGNVVFNMQGANVGAGAAFGGRDARGGANQVIQVTPERAFGALAAVLERLQSVRPGLRDEAAAAADETIEVLKAQPPFEGPPEERHRWVKGALGGLAGLLALAPQLKDAVELGEEAIKGLGWS